jgi:hypothetical protein
MKKEIFVRDDNFPESDVGEELIIPQQDFAQIRQPKLSESPFVDEKKKDEICNLIQTAALYDPSNKESAGLEDGLSIYVVGDNQGVRNNVAAAILNYLSDFFDYVSTSRGQLDHNVYHIDAQQTLAEKIPTEVLTGDGSLKLLVPLESPDCERISYLQKIKSVEKEVTREERFHILMIPDLDEIVSEGIGKGWTEIGRNVLGVLERSFLRPNCVTIGTLKKDPTILYGDGISAGLNKTYNFEVEV